MFAYTIAITQEQQLDEEYVPTTAEKSPFLAQKTSPIQIPGFNLKAV